ncbi:hypothetical protein Mapa_006193 [Marchantia paleacea]|nr:hypothetical protein Mapa_006193 [Marchantia paleacea]
MQDLVLGHERGHLVPKPLRHWRWQRRRSKRRQRQRQRLNAWWKPFRFLKKLTEFRNCC